MLTVLGPIVRCCGGNAGNSSNLPAGIARPDVAQIARGRGAVAFAKGGLSRKRAKSVVFLFLYGGPSQLETFDMKPAGSDAIRGPFKPIDCRTPGLLLCEQLPRIAAISDRICVLRTLTHPYNDHSSAGHYIQTGHPWHVPIGGGFNATEKDWPAMGSIVEYVDQQVAGQQRPIPSYVYLPNRLGHLQTYSVRLDRPGQYAGWLGRGYDALATDIRKRNDSDNPFFRDCSDEDLDFRINGLAGDAALTIDRLAHRQSLLTGFDRRGPA